MDNYGEGVLAIMIGVLTFFVIILIMLMWAIVRIMNENRDITFKINILVESMIEIFENKYKFYDEKEDEESGKGD